MNDALLLAVGAAGGVTLVSAAAYLLYKLWVWRNL